MQEDIRSFNQDIWFSSFKMIVINMLKIRNELESLTENQAYKNQMESLELKIQYMKLKTQLMDLTED